MLMGISSEREEIMTYFGVSTSSCIASSSWVISALRLITFGMYLQQASERKTITECI